MQSLASLVRLASNPLQLEILIKADEDDTETVNLLKTSSSPTPINVTISPRGNGYGDIHNYYNFLAQHAHGDWLMLWNDDARMLSIGWDEIISSIDAQGLWHNQDVVCALSCHVLERKGHHEFPIIRRSGYQVLGHLSLTPHCDSWLWKVFDAVGSAMEAPIIVQHLDKEPEAYATRDNAARDAVTGFDTIEMIQHRLDDSKILLEYIKEKM